MYLMNIDFKTSDIWKYCTVMLITAALTGLPSYILLTAKTTTTTEVKMLVNEYSPYNEDKRAINDAILRHELQIQTIVAELGNISKTQSSISGKLDLLLSRRIK